MTISRRHLMRGAAAAIGAVSAATTSVAKAAPAAGPSHAAFTPPAGPRSRVLIANDLAGDIDGLFATVHALLSPATEIRGIIGTGTRAKQESPERSAELAGEILGLMKLKGAVAVHAGGARLTDAATAVRSAGAEAIVAEAMRTDTKLPLYVTVGAGLSEVASALLLEPRIAERMTLVWIGGGHANTPAGEYNLAIDPLAVQTVFNRSKVPIWQVPSDAYQTCVVSNTELQLHVAPCGAIGAWLYAKLLEAARKYPGLNTGETWTLGDSPLVLLTALNDWPPNVSGRTLRYDRTGSSRYEEVPAPQITAGGARGPADPARTIRLYSSVDTRLMFGDFFAKLRLNYGS